MFQLEHFILHNFFGVNCRFFVLVLWRINKPKGLAGGRKCLLSRTSNAYSSRLDRSVEYFLWYMHMRTKSVGSKVANLLKKENISEKLAARPVKRGQRLS